MSRKKENTSKPTPGRVIRQGKNFPIIEAPPDDPIYTRGFIVGVRRLRKTLKDTKAETSESENSKQ